MRDSTWEDLIDSQLGDADTGIVILTATLDRMTVMVNPDQTDKQQEKWQKRILSIKNKVKSLLPRNKAKS